MIKLTRKQPGELVRGSDFNALLDMIAQTQTLICGPGLETRRTSAGLAVNLVKSPLDRVHRVIDTDPIRGGKSFPAIILYYLDSTYNSAYPDWQPPANENVWKYCYHMASLTGESEFAWTPFDGSEGGTGALPPNAYDMELTPARWLFNADDTYYRTGASTNGIPWRGWCWNLCEQGNTAYGIQGNGVDITALHGTNANMDVQPCPRGAVVMVTPMSGVGKMQFVFSYANAIDGSC
jgi:hypothetical protein